MVLLELNDFDNETLYIDAKMYHIFQYLCNMFSIYIFYILAPELFVKGLPMYCQTLALVPPLTKHIYMSIVIQICP